MSAHFYPHFLPRLDVARPVNRDHPLNHQRAAWWMVSPWGHPSYGPGGGGRLLDLFGTYPGTLSGGTAWDGGGGRRGGGPGALRFSGEGTLDHLNVPQGGGLDGTTDFTIAMWAKWTSATQDLDVFGGSWGAICGRQSNGVFSANLIMLSDTDPDLGVLKFFPYDAFSGVNGSTAVGLNRWRHVCVTSTVDVFGTGVGVQGIYLDGVLDATGAIGSVSAPVDSTIPFTPGAWASDGTCYMIGLLDDISTWQRTMTAAQVYALYEESLRGYPGTLNRLSRAAYFVPLEPGSGGLGGSFGRKRYLRPAVFSPGLGR